jgi:hypothetical protein
MNIEEKYYGEVWLPEKEEIKTFCILEVIDFQVTLTTNLYNHSTEYKIDKIHGQFNKLGVVTLINNIVRNSSSGQIMKRVYEPEYTFISSSHLVKTETLTLNEFIIKNAAFNSWIRQLHFIPPEDNIFTFKNEEIKEVIEINDKKLEIQFTKTIDYKSNKDKIELINCGFVSFKSEPELKILEAIEIYKTFQKFMLFFFGRFPHFESFRFKCLGCNEYISLYYKDRLSVIKNSNFLYFDFFELKSHLQNILPIWYTNQNLEFCTNFVLENKLSQKISHSRRFVNSIFSFEAYYKRFHSGDNTTKNNNLKKSLSSQKELILELTKIQEEGFISFVQKIIRSRDYYVHGNLKQKEIFSEFELLYISFLLDFIVGIQILYKLGFDEKLIKKAKGRAKSVYVDMQQVNKMLNQNAFTKSKTK